MISNKLAQKLLPITIFTLALAQKSSAQDSNDSTKTPWYNIHFQMTYINQVKPKMRSPYSGLMSLQGATEKQNSLTSTLFLGAKLWKGAYAFFNPELAGGSGLSGAQGMGGSSNGETFRVGNPSPTLYLARAYVQQTFALGKEKEQQEDDQNQLQAIVPKDYIKLSVGKFSLADMIDNNEFANSPRTQFLNWSLMNNGAWDFAANVRGYTYAAGVEVNKSFWNYKIIFSALPKVANGAQLDTKYSQSLAINTELGASYKIHQQSGHVKVLYFLNKADMGSYQEAINIAKQTGDTADITATRQEGRKKWGLGLNADQALNNNLGLFARFGYNDGKTETWNFTEIDQTETVGLSLAGAMWHRTEDNAGIAFATNGLSKIHREYIASGGHGFIIGDGKLNYGQEAITEVYYSFKPTKHPLWITGDYQFAVNPGYNKDRGPANIFSVRLHTEF